MLEKVPQKGTDLGVADVVPMAAEVEAEAVALGADGDAGDDRDAVVAVPVIHVRSVATPRPGPAQGWDQEEARLVDEDDVRPPARGVFFTLGHSLRIQRAMRSSSRSRARRSGFWGLNPS